MTLDSKVMKQFFNQKTAEIEKRVSLSCIKFMF